MTEFDHYNALLFDCDGTLADTMPAHWQAWQNFGKETGGWSLYHSLFSIYFKDNYDGKDKLKKIVSFLIESGAIELNLLHGSVVKGTPLDMLDFDNDNDKLIKTKDGKKLYEFLMKKGFKSADDLD